MKRLIFFGLSFLIVFSSGLFSQNYDDICPDVLVNKQALSAQTGGKYKPASHAPGQYLRVLIVFAQFSGDERIFSDWTYGQIPTYSNKLVSTVTASQYGSFVLSDYWKTMSLGNYDVIGDVYQNVVTLRSESWYESNNKNFQDTNLDVLDSINGKIDFKKYDNWGFDSGTSSFFFSPRNADGYLDMMYIIYRKPGIWFGRWGGIAVLGNNFTYVTHDSTIIDGNWLGHKSSGITIRDGAGVHPLKNIGLLAHELGHYLYGSGHTMLSGLMVGDPYPTSGGTFALSGWERERLGYSAYTTPDQDNFTVTLQDFVTTGQVLKIPVPGSSNKYFVVENHQRLSKYDQIMQGGQLQGTLDTTTTLGKGIYVWLIKNANNFPPTVDVKTANGNWNWTYVGDYYAGPGWYKDKPWEGYLPKTERASVNRDDWGKSDRYPYHIYWNNHMASKWVDTNYVTKQYDLTRNVMGLETHAFNYNYTRLFTPWSSPSTYVDGVTNTSMQVYSEHGSNITLKIFNTYNSSINLPPSKPQHLLVEPSVNLHPYLTWAANIEPDFSYYLVQKYVTVDQGWQTIAQTTNTYYEDLTESYCPPGHYCEAGHNVSYRITAVDSQALSSVPSDVFVTHVLGGHPEKIAVNPGNELPLEYSLLQNYPNPFNPNTTISFVLKEAGHVSLKVYNTLGQKIVELTNEIMESGYHTVEFNAADLPSGIYLYKIQSGNFVQSKKMLLLK